MAASPQPAPSPAVRQPGILPKAVLLACAALAFGHLFYRAAHPRQSAHPARIGLINAEQPQDLKALFAAGLVLPSPLELASTPLAFRLTFPLGSENGALTYNARLFGEVNHLGDDLNGIGGENSDLGDPIYAIGDGIVVYSAAPSEGWGNTVLLQHRRRDGRLFQSFYGHLDTVRVSLREKVHRGQILGTVGTANGKYLAHLHFEIRDSISIGAGLGYHPLRLDRKNPTEYLQEYQNGAASNLLPALETFDQAARTDTLPDTGRDMGGKDAREPRQ